MLADMTNRYPSHHKTMVAKAWKAFTAGHVAEARSLATTAAAGRPIARRDRQRAEIVALAIAGELDRAADLAAEHLAEFPSDELIRGVREWAARYPNRG